MAEKMPGRYLAFDSVAEDYDRTRVIPAAQLEDIARLCAQEARLQEGGLFLDAGVGTGRFAVSLTRMYPGQIIGVDISVPMMAHAQAKATAMGRELPLISADLQRLPFKGRVFQAALVVHILHLIEQWPLVLEELRQLLDPVQGVLLLGREVGGRSVLVDFYLERARIRRALSPYVGAVGLTEVLAYLRRTGPVETKLLSAPYLNWKRSVPVRETLAALEQRTYSQLWEISEATHRELIAETSHYARRNFTSLDAPEELRAHFVLHAVRWHSR